MTITSFEDLRAQFFANTFTPKARGKKSDPDENVDDLPDLPRNETFIMPYWTIYSTGFGEKDRILSYNERLTNPEEAFGLLAETIRRNNNPTGQVFQILQTYRPRHNTGNWYKVQIYENAHVPNYSVAGIHGGGAAIGYLSPAEVQEKINEALEKQELKAKISALEENQNGFVGQLTKFLEGPVGSLLAAKMLGVPVTPPAQVAINGTPDATPASGGDDDEFFKNLDAITAKLGTDDLTLVKKLRALVDTNPTLAKQLLETT